MKKLLMIAMMFATVSFATAQVTPKSPMPKKEKMAAKDTKMAAKDAKQDTKMAAKDTKKDAKMATKDAKQDTKMVAKEGKPAAGMKKDGTPDMRMKANKDAKTPVKGPVKKDGTPDMRYNKNKGK